MKHWRELQMNLGVFLTDHIETSILVVGTIFLAMTIIWYIAK